MTRGIYIVGNDKVIEQAIACLNSVRLYDPKTPIILIPYDDNYHKIAEILRDLHQVKVYEDFPIIERLSQQLSDIFGEDFFARPNVLRKLACWLGELENFLYIDTDIVVFERLIDSLDYLQDYDFLCCDYQYRTGITNVFNPIVKEQGIFSESELEDTFNSGLWAGKKNLFSESDLYETLAECAAHKEYFDFSQKTSDQPILNYVVFKHIKKRFNLVKKTEKGPGNWAGSPHFIREGNILIDPKVNLPLQYLHWAGIRIEPGCPYWDIWKYYRYLGETDIPSDEQLKPSQSQWQQLQKKLRGWMKK